MNTEEKWQYIFRKHPEAKYNRAMAYWLFGETFYGFKIYALKSQLMEFFRDFAGIERSCRDVLKEEEFKLKPEQDSKIQEKRAEFQEKYKQIANPDEREQFEDIFGKKSYYEDE